MGTFSPWFSGTPSYSTYSSDMGGSSLLGDRPSIKDVQKKSGESISVSMPKNSTTVINQSTQPAKKQQGANANANTDMMKNIRTFAKMAKQFMNKPSDVTGTGPSVPGYSIGMDMSGEEAIMAADLAESLGTADIEGIIAAEGLMEPLAAEGIMGAGEAISAEAVAGLGSTAFATEGALATEGAVEGAAIAEGAAAAEAGLSSTGVGAIIAAAIAAVMALESSGGYEGINEIIRQVGQGMEDIENLDVVNFTKNSFTNLFDLANAAERTIGNVFGFNARDIGLNNLLTSLFNFNQE